VPKGHWLKILDVLEAAELTIRDENNYRPEWIKTLVTRLEALATAVLGEGKPG
jgi:hypothetical protein